MRGDFLDFSRNPKVGMPPAEPNHDFDDDQTSVNLSISPVAQISSQNQKADQCHVDHQKLS